MRVEDLRPNNCRKARSRLGWTRKDLAKAAKVTVYQVTRVEWGQDINRVDEQKILAALTDQDVFVEKALPIGACAAH